MCFQTDFHYKAIYWTAIATIGVLTGVAIFGIVEGFQMKSVYQDYRGFLSKHYVTICTYINTACIIGVLVFVVTLAALLVQWYPILLLQAILIIVLSATSVGLGTWLMVISQDIHREDGILLSIIYDMEMVLDQPDNLSFNNTLLDPIQRDLECCGIHNWKDYWRPLTKMWMADILPLPKSCCLDPDSNCKPNTKEHKQEGCLGKLLIFTISFFNSAGTIMFVCSMAMIILSGLVFILAMKAKEYYYMYPFYM